MLPSSPLARHAVAGANLGDRTAHPRGGRPHYRGVSDQITGRKLNARTSFAVLPVRAPRCDRTMQQVRRRRLIFVSLMSTKATQTSSTIDVAGDAC